jgi:hypothetical protein
MIDWNSDSLKKLSLDDLDKRCINATKNKRLYFTHSNTIKRTDQNWKFLSYLVMLLLSTIAILYVKDKSY